jgi:hypothetical protein
MLIASLLLSLLLLAVVNVVVRTSGRRPLLAVFLSAAGAVGLQFFFQCFFPAVLLQTVLLVGAAFAWRLRGWRAWTFLPLSACATVLAYALPTWWAYEDYAHLRERFAFVSLEERLPPPKPTPGAGLQPDAERRLSRMEEEIEAEQAPVAGAGRLRLTHLRELHENAVSVFVNRPGFGVARITPHLPGESTMTEGLRTNPPLPQPGRRISSFGSTGDAEGTPVARWRYPVGLYEGSVRDFVNPRGFGYVQDRRHVAGFQPHGFSEVPGGGAWKLETLDLVGLVVHTEPVVYASSVLPRMESLGEVPTRPPDRFEAAGLEALRQGEDLFARDVGDRLRALGALRSARQCVGCHEGQRGDLLGAFSYSLTWDGL